MYAGRYLNPSITLLIVDDQELVLEALASLCARIRGLEVVGLACPTADVMTSLGKGHPDLILWSVSREPDFFESVSAVMRTLHAAAKVVLLDERTIDAHARQALRLAVAGYLTKNSRSAVRTIAARSSRGRAGLVPDVSERLQFTSDGMRLAASGDAGPLSRLTAREMDVLVQISQGLTARSVPSCWESAPARSIITKPG